MAVSAANRLDPRDLLERLAQGGILTGARLARELGTTRAELAAFIRTLRESGVDICAVGAQGYRLPAPLELLDARKVGAALHPQARAAIRRLDVMFEVDSTNTRLLELAPGPPGCADVCVSELQRAGRGRRGRPWISPFGGSLALSLGWSFPAAGPVTPALSLGVGVAISRALTRLGAREIRLKWPNDIWLGTRKVGGVLVELRTEAGGAAHVVIGVGLNVSLSAGQRQGIEAAGVRVAAVSDACPGPVSRNALAANLIEELLSMLGEFERSGFAAFRQEWLALDALAGRTVRLLSGDESIEGTARGVDPDGALLLEAGRRLQRHVSGEVSLRLNEGLCSNEGGM